MDDQVSVKWKYATMGLGVLVVAQFFWWDSKCPQVLRGGGGYSGLSAGYPLSRR